MLSKMTLAQQGMETLYKLLAALSGGVDMSGAELVLMTNVTPLTVLSDWSSVVEPAYTGYGGQPMHPFILVPSADGSFVLKSHLNAPFAPTATAGSHMVTGIVFRNDSGGTPTIAAFLMLPTPVEMDRLGDYLWATLEIAFSPSGSVTVTCNYSAHP